MMRCTMLLFGFFLLSAAVLMGQQTPPQLQYIIEAYEAADKEQPQTPWPSLEPRKRENRRIQLAEWLAMLADIPADIGE